MKPEGLKPRPVLGVLGFGVSTGGVEFPPLGSFYMGAFVRILVLVEVGAFYRPCPFVVQQRLRPLP